MATQSLGSQPVERLSIFMIWLYPLLYSLSSPEKRIWLDRCLAFTREERLNDKRLKSTERTVLPEARVYAEIIQSTLDHAGLYHRPHHEFDGPEQKQRAKKKASIGFDWIGYNENVVWLRIKTTKRGLFNRHVSALPQDVSIEDICNDIMRENLSHAVKRTVRFKRNEYSKGLWIKVFRLETVDDLPAMVEYQKIRKWYPANDEKQILSKMPILLGVGEYRYIHQVNLNDYPHILVAGASGGGKSNIVNIMISTLIRYISPSDLQLVLIDPKRIEFSFYEGIPHLHGKGVVMDIHEAIKTFEWVVSELERRNKLLQGNVKNIAEHNEAHPDKKLPMIMVIVDEYAALKLLPSKRVADQVEALIAQISNMGRAVGIKLVLCTQRPVVNVISNAIKLNCELVIGVKTRNIDQSRVILDDGELALLPKVKGRCIYDTGMDRETVQSAFISNADVRECIGISKGKDAGFILLVDDQPDIDKQKLIDYLIKTRAGRVTGFEHGKFAINNALWKNFTDWGLQAGEIEKHGNRLWIKGYVIENEPETEPIPESTVTIEPPDPVLALPSGDLKQPEPVPTIEPEPEPPKPTIIEAKPRISQDDWFIKFVDSEIDQSDALARTPTKDLYDAYLKFCQQNKTPPFNPNKFADHIRSNTNAIHFKTTTTRGYSGIKLRMAPVASVTIMAPVAPPLQEIA